MPIEQLRGGCLNPGSRDEHVRPRHIFHAVLPAHVAHAAFRNREANRATGETPGATRKTVTATQFHSCEFLVRMNAPASAPTSSRFLLHHVLKISSPRHRIFRPRQLCAVSCTLFRAIQRRIRQSQNFLRVRRRLIHTRRNSETRSHRNRNRIGYDRLGFNRAPDSFCQPHRALRVGRGHHDQDFLSAVAPHRIVGGRTQAAKVPNSNPHQHTCNQWNGRPSAQSSATGKRN